MPAKRRPRAKRAPVVVRRVRPESVQDQLKDVRAWMLARAQDATDDAERAYFSEIHDRVHVVHVRDTHGPEIWPDCPDAARSRAEDLAILAEYRAMFDGE